MRKLIGIASVFALLIGGAQAAEEPSLERVHSRHMVAEAMLTAHFVAAAIKAGMTRGEIEAVLSDIAKRSAVTEFWVSDEKGRVVFTSVKGIDFTFPTDPAAGTQAAPFAELLNGAKTVVVQQARPREADGKLFKYVGAAGVDRPRIVQVGVSGQELAGR